MLTHYRAKTSQPSAIISTKYPLPTSNLPFGPSCFTQANRDIHGRKAMQEEYNALIQNGTWTLVPASNATNIVGSKWVFKLKTQPG